MDSNKKEVPAEPGPEYYGLITPSAVQQILTPACYICARKLNRDKLVSTKRIICKSCRDQHDIETKWDDEDTQPNGVKAEPAPEMTAEQVAKMAEMLKEKRVILKKSGGIKPMVKSKGPVRFSMGRMKRLKSPKRLKP